MKFKDKFPNMIPIETEQECIIRGYDALPCLMCGEPTEFVEICAEAPFCSEECVSEFYSGMQ